MEIYIVTNLEMECVLGAFKDKKYVDKIYGDNDMYEISSINFSENTLDEEKIKNDLKKYGRKDTTYEISDYYRIKDMSIITDALDVIIDNCDYVGNTHELISLIIDNWIDFAKENNIKYNNVYLTHYENTGGFWAFYDGLNSNSELKFNKFLKNKNIKLR